MNEIEEIIREYAPVSELRNKVLEEAMKYSLEAGGKRLRPKLMAEAYRMFGGRNEKLLHPFLAAIEMIHTYSLIHDDLPAMDNDDFRRGRPTSHKVYGEAMAILAGDALLNYAMETACKAFFHCENIDEYENAARALTCLFHYSGMNGMIGGQVLDVVSEGSKKNEAEDFFISMYDLKTGGLIKAALETGAILAGAGEKDVEAMRKTGAALGLVFQLQDDILDITGDEKKLGKPLHSDEKNNKVTYLGVLGREKAAEVIAANSAYIYENLNNFCNRNKNYDRKIISLIEHLKNRDR